MQMRSALTVFRTGQEEELSHKSIISQITTLLTRSFQQAQGFEYSPTRKHHAAE